MTKGQEVAVPETSSYAIVRAAQEGTGALAEIMRENIGAGGITPFDLDRVKVPSGAGSAWEIPTLTGDTDVAKSFDGIIVAWREPRAYWKLSIDDGGGGAPPDCSSEDGVLGVGDPGGACKSCPYAQFGSGKDDRGQACKQMRLLFVVRENSLLPIALFAPPTSIKNIRKYFMRLASENRRYSSVVTNFSLSKDTSGGGVEYSKVEVKVVRMLEPEEAAAAYEYSTGIASAVTAAVSKLTEDMT